MQKPGDLTRSGGMSREFSHESRTTWPALPAAAVVRDFNVGGKSTVYHIEQIPQLFVRFSPVPLLSLCPNTAGPDAFQLCVCVCVCVYVCVCVLVQELRRSAGGGR